MRQPATTPGGGEEGGGGAGLPGKGARVVDLQIAPPAHQEQPPLGEGGHQTGPLPPGQLGGGAGEGEHIREELELLLRKQRNRIIPVNRPIFRKSQLDSIGCISITNAKDCEGIWNGKINVVKIT